MELKDFVKTTITELSDALQEANSEIGTGRKIKMTNTSLLPKGYGNDGLIEFDLAVTAAESKTTGGKAGIKVAVIQGGAGKEKYQSITSVSRIKFTVEANL